MEGRKRMSWSRSRMPIWVISDEYQDCAWEVAAHIHRFFHCLIQGVLVEMQAARRA